MKQNNEKWTLNSTLGDVLDSIIGYELLAFIAYYSGKSVEDFNKFYLRSIKLKSYTIIQRFTRIMFDRRITTWIIDKLNQYEQRQDLCPDKISFNHKWWKSSIIYQIFVPSFQDANHDGIGDLKGIIERFEHIISLNVDTILLSPIFDSPMYDAGYDIKDFYKINPLFGSKKDLKELINLCQQNNLKIILTLPLSQTSDQHAWFDNSKDKVDVSSENNHIADNKNFYIVNDGPNNWQSFYGDSAWLYQRSAKKYYLHLKSSKQLDLNWDMDYVREEMINIMRYWKNFGIDGLFLESASIIAKNEAYAEGSKSLAVLTGVSGIENYIYQCKLLDWLSEIYLALKQDSPDFLIIADCLIMHSNYTRLISGDATNRSDLGLTYNQFEEPGQRRFQSNYLSLDYLSNIWLKMQLSADNSFWPVLFCEDPNHPRIISRMQNHNLYRNQIAKLIATLQLTAKGTVMLYQGQELGQINAPFHTIEQIRDIESQLRYEKLNEQLTLAENSGSLDRIIRGSRDHARVPIVWDNEFLNGDFSQNKTTWIDCFADPKMSVAEQGNDSHSILNYYRALTSLRSHYATLIYGKLEILSKHNTSILRYFRYDDYHAFYIEANLTDEILNVIGFSTTQLLRQAEEYNIKVPDSLDRTILISNYPDRNQQDFIKNSELRPYETFIVKLF
ncbi:MAG: alpha-amylase family glycosyl hydrolase [Saccharofermentanales bacterium]|jgi:oligo-1,6-glucosidase